MKIFILMLAFVYVLASASCPADSLPTSIADDSESCVLTSPTIANAQFLQPLYDQYSSSLKSLYKELRASLPQQVTFMNRDAEKRLFCLAITRQNIGDPIIGITAEIVITTPYNIAVTTFESRAATNINYFGLKALRTLAESEIANDDRIQFFSILITWSKKDLSKASAVPTWESVYLSVPKQVMSDFRNSTITAQSALGLSAMTAMQDGQLVSKALDIKLADSLALPTLPSSQAKVETLSDPYELAKKGGCIGQPLDNCLKNLQIAFDYTKYDSLHSVTDQIKRNDAVDINGKKISKNNLIIISGNLMNFDGISRLQSIDLEYSDQNLVKYIGISLPQDPSLANTIEEYEKTGLYEGVVLLLGSECQNITREETYKFFQNKVKPKIISEGRKVEIHDTNAETKYFKKALDISFCGHKFSYTDLFGYNTDYIKLENPHGAYSIVSISFK